MIYPRGFGGLLLPIVGFFRRETLIVLKLKIREAGTVNALLGSIMCTGLMSQSEHRGEEEGTSRHEEQAQWDVQTVKHEL